MQNYCGAVLDHVFRCKACGLPLLMFGCGNPGCARHYLNDPRHIERWDQDDDAESGELPEDDENSR